MEKDLEAILDYCQSDGEWEDFFDYLCDDGVDFLTDKELDIMRTSTWDKKNYQEIEDKQEKIMKKIAKNKECSHIWAVAQRVRDYCEANDERRGNHECFS